MSVACPKCGVAVVPGYVKCPKCQAVLPQRRAMSTTAGGTSSLSEGGMSPWLVAAIVAAVGVGIVVFAMRGGGDKPASVDTAAPLAAPEKPPERPTEPTENPTPTAVPAPAADPTVAVRELDRALRKERLWGTIEVVGSRVEVRTASCREATMMPVLDAAIPALRQAGVTKLRCLEQAGALVFEREI